ncbi:hypothetical protein NLI96_g2222 [Meripilus lineatus]|uniref:Transmembrane protein n=1 Tax=Meripilus lineatus TaxID=2056292 RepID=A0AAD5VAL6_9APHY|nr:hypothetical protein NLI96_g2222 [Physisporinus lineatus]
MHTHTQNDHPPRRRFTIAKTWRRPSKVYRVFALASFNIACNVAILYAAFHTYRFGASITNGSWWITDNTLLSIIEFAAKLPAASTVSIGRLAVSHLWSREWANMLSGTEIEELRSLNVFGSVLSILRAVSRIVRGCCVFAQKPYSLMVLSAILLLFYSTAVVTLATPALIFVNGPIVTYTFAELPFMTQPGYGNRCIPPSPSNSEARSCLQLMLAENAMTDVGGYNGTQTWSEDGSYPLWTKLDITFNSGDAEKGSIVSAIPLGPTNGVDLTDGVFVIGSNMATVESLLNKTDSMFRESTEFLIQVGTTVPLLTCRCEKVPRSSDNISTVTISGDAYTLIPPIPLLQDGEAVGQVTADDATLLLSFGGQESKSITHCAIDLILKPVDMTIHSSSPHSNIPSSAVVSPSQNPWELRDITALPHDRHSSMQNFSDYWMGGIGWSTSPKRSAIVSFLAGLPIGTGTAEGFAKNGSYLEYSVLTMLASGVSMGFPPEHPISASTSSLPSTSLRSYRVIKREYYIGLQTRFQAFLTFVVIFDCIFVVCCLVVIIQDEWYPVWTDPACTFACIPLV